MEDVSEPTPLEPQDTSRPTIFLVLGLLVAFILGIGAGYLVFARPLEGQIATLQIAATEAAQAAAQQQAAAEKQAEAEKQAAAQQPAAGEQQTGEEQANQEVKRYPVPIDDDPILGNVDAPITIIEFSDYECPYCQRWHLEVRPQIKQKYGDKIRFVFRDFPLYSIHPNAIPAAVAANCAGEQDRYWDFNERLFSGQDPLNRVSYEKIATDLNLKVVDFQQCLDENRYQAEVEADLAYASELGVRSTPTFFINGLAIVGAQPFEVFEQVIDLELAGEIP